MRAFTENRLHDAIVSALEGQNATPELGWGHEHHVTTGAARDFAESILVGLVEAGFAVVERGCEHEFDFECARCVTLDAFHPWRTPDFGGFNPGAAGEDR